MTIPEVPDDMYVRISGTFYITFLLGHFTQSCLPVGKDAKTQLSQPTTQHANFSPWKVIGGILQAIVSHKG